MAKIKKRTFEREYVQIPNETAKSPEIKGNENPVSLEALGLLVNLWAYDLDKWELHKTELYKRYAFNKETSVNRCWKELIKAGYMVEYKYREGKKWEYVYIFNILPFTEEQRRILWKEGVEEHGEIWGLDFPDLTVQTSKWGPQDPELYNINKRNTKKRNTKQSNTKIVNKVLNNDLDNSKKEDIKYEHQLPKPREVKYHPKADYQGQEPYGTFFDKVANSFYNEFAINRWNKQEWKNLVNKMYLEAIVDEETEIISHKAYIHQWLTNIANYHDLKNGKKERNFVFYNRPDIKNPELEGKERPHPVFYNWLEEEGE